MRALLVLGALLLVAAPALAAEWGPLAPGRTTRTQVRERFGAPTRAEVVKVDGYDTDRWTYEGAQAPPGVRRMVAEFGLKDDRGYNPDVLRDFRLEPKPGVFHKGILDRGWGPPDRVTRDGQRQIFLWASGLVAYFETPNDLDPSLLLFGLPQPLAPPR